MKRTLIIYHSEHHGNTKKVAKEIAKTLDADLTPSSTPIKNIEKYDLIGFGSGIYYGKFHDNIYKIINSLPYQNSKLCFIFSTAGSKSYGERGHELLKRKLKEKGFKIIGEFSCLGYDTALFSEGINHGRPNDDDLQKARVFAQRLIEQ